MIKLLTPLDIYEKLKDRDYVDIECSGCGMTFSRRKQNHKDHLGRNNARNAYCSNACQAKYTLQKPIKVNCKQCGKETIKLPYQLKNAKEGKNGLRGNLFCDHTCSAIYNNTHKTHGYRRSKMEIYIEKVLTWLYPSLNIKYNNNKTIGYELDIYVPPLKLAFELNGIFHYSIVYRGQDGLDKIQNNDRKKSQLCLEAGINLCVLDVSKEKHFKEKHATKYINIITDIINAKLENHEFVPDYERYK